MSSWKNMRSSNQYRDIPEKPFDDNILDMDSGIIDTDIKINPDFYIHLGLMNAQQALLKDNTEQGFLQFWVIVEHIEGLAIAANLVPPDYDEKINEFKTGVDFKDIKSEITRNVRLSNYKLKLLMTEIFARKTLTTPLSLNARHDALYNSEKIHMIQTYEGNENLLCRKDIKPKAFNSSKKWKDVTCAKCLRSRPDEIPK